MALPEDLHTLEGVQSLARIGTPDWMAVDGAHCPNCGDRRRMEVVTNFWKKPPPQDGPERKAFEIKRENTPAVLRLHCVQCRGQQTLVIFWGPQGRERG